MVDKSKKVPLGELSAYERWELPNIGDPSLARSQARNQKQEKPKLPTAEQIESITKQAYESGFEEGHNDGFSKGYEAGKNEGIESGKKEGYQQGIQQAQKEVDREKARLKGLMAQLTNPIEQQQQLVEEAMLNIAVALSRTVIHRELNLDSSSLLLTLSRVIDELPALDAGAVLRVNARDKAIADEALAGLNASVETVADPSVQVGGFLLKTSSQVIDYTVEKRFQKAVQGMLDAAVNQKPSSMQEVPSTIDALSDYSPETLNEEPEMDAEISVEKETEEALHDNGRQVSESDPAERDRKIEDTSVSDEQSSDEQSPDIKGSNDPDDEVD